MKITHYTVEGTYHYIPTAGSPVKIPTRHVPAHFKEEMETQIQSMLDNNIIEPSNSPWMPPAVFVKKKTGDIRLCIDYRALNKRTTHDTYLLPLPDEVQGYWQLPVNPSDKEKTAFCPGPGMGLFQINRMPFGLMGAPSSFQRFMDKIFRGLSFVSIYLDDIFIHSPDEKAHKAHLQEVFSRLSEAGVTLHGKKYRIGMMSVTYLGHVFQLREWNLIPTKFEQCKNGLSLEVSQIYDSF